VGAKDQEGNGSKYHVPNLDRALSVLELLSKHPKGLIKNEIAETLKLSPNSVYRITMTLVDRGYLNRNDRTRRLSLSNKMMELRLSAVDDLSLVDKSWDIMCALRDTTTETVHLEARLGDGGVILEEAEGLHNLRFTCDLGTTFELHAAAPGKVFLAFMGDDERSKFLGGMKFTRYNQRTITSRAKLDKELEVVRREGYALDRAEIVDGIHCVSAPVFDGNGLIVAALTVTGPTARLPESSLPKIARQVMGHAKMISKRLGHDGR